MNPRYRDSDDGHDAAKDAYHEGWGMPATASQRREFEAEVQAEKDAERYGW
jgi:hypothetical protein